MCLYHSKTLLVKQGTFLYEVWPDSAEKRDICNTGILTSGRKSNIEILFIDELLVISESRTLYFSNSGIFVDGSNKENRAIKLKINWIVSQSVIYLSGRTQGSEFWADLLTVSLSLETFWFLWWIVIIIGNNKLENFQLVNCWSLVKLWNIEH